jgi:hypothetical protein
MPAKRTTKKEEEVVQEEVVEVKAEKKAEEPGKLVATQELQLKINDRKVLNVHPFAKRVVIENQFGGDLYVSTESTQFTEADALKEGQSIEIKDVAHIFVGSFSRPVFKVSHFSK